LSWIWEEIDQDWLLGARFAVPSHVVVEAFKQAEQMLGRDWIDRWRVFGTPSSQYAGLRLHLALHQWANYSVSCMDCPKPKRSSAASAKATTMRRLNSLSLSLGGGPKRCSH